MKRILLMTCLFVCAHVALAQDIIVKKTGDEIKVKVLEITLDVVKYKTQDNLEGPTISVKIDDLFMIKYGNGTKHVFKDEVKKDEAEAEEEDFATISYAEKANKPTTVTYSKIEYQREKSDIGVYHAIKVAPLLILNGEIPIYYERRMGKHLSLELGLGITHQDYLYRGLSVNDYATESREAQMGFSVAGALKFYPSKYTMAMDEMYFGPSIRYKHYNTTLVACDGNATTNYEETRDIVDYQLSGGYVYWVTDRVLFDLYAGIGMRTKVYNEAYCDVSGPVSVTVPPAIYKATAPAITLGFKFGFGF